MVDDWIKDTNYKKSIKIENLVSNKEEFELLQRISKYLFSKCIKEADGCLTIPVIEVQRLQDVLSTSYQEEFNIDMGLLKKVNY